MQRLILKDGTVIDGGSAGYAEGFLWLWFSGYSLQEAAAMVFDSSRMARITVQYGGEMEDVFEGFTVCVNLMTGTDGEISVCMTKAVVA